MTALLCGQPAGMAEGSCQGPAWAPPGQTPTLEREPETPAWAPQQGAQLIELPSILQKSNFSLE